jgi:Amt family ammonium transporter
MLNQVWSQFISVVVTIVWCATLSYIILKVIDKTIGLRVDEEAEIQGLDLSSHDEKGYNL